MWSLEFRLRKLDETRIYFLEEIKPDDLMSGKYKKGKWKYKYDSWKRFISTTALK